GVGCTASLTRAGFGEAVCSVSIILGLATRLSALPFLITMLVAAFIVHGDDPWARKELALVYAVPALTLLLTGPGRLSVDAWLGRWQQQKRSPD
ncbi:MAG: DoxX family protein, partial [Sandaracinaceae bacterium]